MSVRIEGIEQMERDLSQFPINADKVVNAAMRKGGSAVAKAIRPGVPSAFRHVVGSKVYTKGSGATCMVGLFLGKERKSSSGNNGIPAFYKAYWQNYGTLENRDATHKFDRKRRDASANWKGGIRPRHWFEKASEGKESVYVSAMSKEYDRLIQKVWENGRATV